MGMFQVLTTFYLFNLKIFLKLVKGLWIISADSDGVKALKAFLKH